jgi:drug/metabolite transporter (DMT)-like permease
VTCIGALSLLYAIGHTLGAHPIAFILYAVSVSAIATLAVVGVGVRAHAIAIIRHPLSWVVGLCIILLEVFYYQTLAYVSPAHGNVMLRVATPIAMVAGWFLFRRRMRPLAIAGAGAIVATTLFVIAVTAPAVRWPMAATGTLAAVFLVARGFAAEIHPWNRGARTVREKLRVTGLIILVTSIMSLLLAAIAAGAEAAHMLPHTPLVPTAAQMLHAPTFLMGGLAGGAVFTLMMYLNFASVVKITTENLTAMMAFSPATAWLFQALGDEAGLITAPTPEPRIVAAIVVCIAAVLLIFWTDAPAPTQRLPRRLARRLRAD